MHLMTSVPLVLILDSTNRAWSALQSESGPLCRASLRVRNTSSPSPWVPLTSTCSRAPLVSAQSRSYPSFCAPTRFTVQPSRRR